jgi:hypothetical protein
VECDLVEECVGISQQKIPFSPTVLNCSTSCAACITGSNPVEPAGSSPSNNQKALGRVGPNGSDSEDVN